MRKLSIGEYIHHEGLFWVNRRTGFQINRDLPCPLSPEEIAVRRVLCAFEGHLFGPLWCWQCGKLTEEGARIPDLYIAHEKLGKDENVSASVASQ